MNFKKILTIALVSAAGLTAAAQEGNSETVFNHHWFVQAQGGISADIGEINSGKLLSPHVQIAGGYQFTPVWGLRLAVSGWESRAGSNLISRITNEEVQYNWKWNYIAPMLDATCDLTNWIGGYKPSRLCSVGLLAGLGANIAWNNGQASDANQFIATNMLFPAGTDVAFLEYLWCGTKARFVGRAGAYLDFHITKRIDLGIELTANTLSDTYNSKKGNNTDWYFNGLAGIRVRLGKVNKKVSRPAIISTDRLVERIVERDTVFIEKEKTVTVNGEREIMRREVFFTIRDSEVDKTEMLKIEEVAAYMKKYNDAKLSLTGYADKGTGNAELNMMYAQKRAEFVRDLFINKFGISANRITIEAKGDTEQPHLINDLNRVCICIAE